LKKKQINPKKKKPKKKKNAPDGAFFYLRDFLDCFSEAGFFAGRGVFLDEVGLCCLVDSFVGFCEESFCAFFVLRNGEGFDLFYHFLHRLVATCVIHRFACRTANIPFC
jgi:hypothetical protein